MIDNFEKTNSKTLLNTPVFNVVENQFKIDGKEASHPFYSIEHGPWVNAIPITEDGKIVMVKQYRVGIDRVTLEIPGGMVDPGEDIQLAAERETLEETGYKGDQTIFLGQNAPNPAIQTGFCFSYLLLNCKKIKEQNLDDTERIEVLTLSLDEVEKAIVNGEIVHALVIVAFQYYYLYKKLS